MKTLNVGITALFFWDRQYTLGTITYTSPLVGTSEVPPTGSPGIGEAIVIVNTTAQTIEVDVVFSGLLGTTTASHIHCCTTSPGIGNAGVATTTPYVAGFPIGVTSGSYDDIFDLTASSTYNPAFVTEERSVANAEAALLAGLAAGDAYLNIHSTVDPGGEIRGYLVATPEPATFLTLSLALAALAILRRARAA
jgi:hypothetical protein